MIDICCGVIFAIIIIYVVSAIGDRKPRPRRPPPTPLPKPKAEVFDMMDNVWGPGGQAYKRNIEYWDRPVGVGPGKRRMF